VEVIQCRVLPKRGRDVYLKKPTGIASNKMGKPKSKDIERAAKIDFIGCPKTAEETSPAEIVKPA
jgi:hypothetical protein